MIKQKTLDEINDLPLLDVIQKYVPGLKKQGANWMASSPFTEDKTASFSVSPVKGCWKCFSTGIGGNNGISFLMKARQMSFTDAVRALAQDFAITVEFDNDDKSQENIRKQEQRMQISDVNARAVEFFQLHLKNLPADQWRVDEETADIFSIGYAPDNWTALYEYLMNKGIDESLILKAELASKSDSGKIYDFFRNRIMFPIYDRQRRIVGFSGRALSKDERAKYLNSRETLLFDKSRSFLGIDVARDQIVKTGAATIVEGNFDVTAMHKAGFHNTVAGCGTAFTENHVSELRKLGVKTLLFVYDGDEPGKKALKKAIETAVSEGMLCECAVLPEGMDPDDFFKENKKQDLDEIITDAVEYYAGELFKDVNTTVRRTQAEAKLENFLSTIKDAKLRNNYITTLSKTYGFNKTDAEKGVKARIIERNKSDEDDGTKKWRFPAYLEEEAKKDFDIHGFYEDEKPNKIGYWFGTQNYGFEQVSNFLVKPLFHIVSHSNNRRLVEIKNKHG
ncbi:MAG: DNA primase, partial [Balneolaceae bacterium]|nr:DNA primase [Balneolaceae bacterium]